MSLKIGTSVWAKTSNSKITEIDSGDSWKRFLIIGEYNGTYALLVPNNYAGFLWEKNLAKYYASYQIDDQYLGSKICIVFKDAVRYFGKICIKCRANFDYLAGFSTKDQYYFKCWECEI